MKYRTGKIDAICNSEIFKFHKSQALLTKEAFELPPFLEIQFLVCRKQAQLAFFVSPFAKWESIATAQYGKKHPYDEHRLLIQDVMRKDYLPKIEMYYQCPVEQYYFFEPHYQQGYIYGFSVKVFSSSIFRTVDQHQTSVEEEITNVFSARMRTLNGRGPKNVTVSIMGERFVFFRISGLLGPFYCHYAVDNLQAAMLISNMIKELSADVIDYVCHEYFKVVPEKFIEVDLAENEILALAVIKPLGDQDFCRES